MHPLIRKVDKICDDGKRDHTLIEGYIDSYLVRYKYKKTINIRFFCSCHDYSFSLLLHVLL